ncbi:hypothetical protein [Nioella nitratireducens]|uniref:hypothetical protein n=1 Tax=Nioella nitratireducens TaxID=1287720 RepID=UPI0008FCEE7D|nr:hypothetical protein [Nioella nitratireducens]
MIRILTRAALLALIPLTAAAQEVPQGRFELETCSGNPYSDGVLEITGREILFYESACSLSNPEPVRGMEAAYLWDGQCAGEGESWTARYLIMPDWENGLVFVQEHWAATYAYCGPTTAPAPSTPSSPAPGGGSK